MCGLDGVEDTVGAMLSMRAPGMAGVHGLTVSPPRKESSARVASSGAFLAGRYREDPRTTYAHTSIASTYFNKTIKNFLCQLVEAFKLPLLPLPSPCDLYLFQEISISLTEALQHQRKAHPHLFIASHLALNSPCAANEYANFFARYI